MNRSKKKPGLNDLSVKSFLTNAVEIKGGAADKEKTVPVLICNNGCTHLCTYQDECYN